MPSYVRAGIRKCARIRALSFCWLPLWHLSRFLRRLSKILTLRLCLVPKLDIISLSLTKAAYSWQVLYLKIGFRLVGHTL